MDRMRLPAISARAQGLGTENAFVVLAEVNVRAVRVAVLDLHLGGVAHVHDLHLEV